ncbi:MaoC family dehydratase N-terminal domain-containing protein [Catenulispora sp. NF23]|uniref:MaoC family dehydratase N-terminal domain-containing protein n=1 Tax=Catenulispora pinistramenti TaxID=2705254 RepID=A0ABS5KK59_9ACTN|nr:MaoC/PaaZ C-terminal domain-containing protein [Catenulispora pinistramenti]MBS2531159.1 MaoC family dehydratase N-terminal domain-containing protein [Catenulispora pinistramenti]MBS2545921.1 MaoC family dehydratase N-terminal domain-containing protein [Catenulispora pinistramenti]
MDKDTELPERSFRITRADLVRYAGASGDFNPIHWHDRTAAENDLPGVIAHGMFTMALAAQALVDWTGDPAGLVEYEVRFSKPVAVPDDEIGAEVVVSGVIQSPTAEGRTRIEISATCAGQRVLGRGSGAVTRNG